MGRKSMLCLIMGKVQDAFNILFLKYKVRVLNDLIDFIL